MRTRRDAAASKALESVPPRRYRATVEYDGTDFK
jgi:hypothetical protein